MPEYEDHPLNSYYGNKRMEGTEDWVTVAELGDGGYEWAEFKAFWSPSELTYFWHGGCGCSCNSWDDEVHSASDFENGDKFALLAAWGRFVKDNEYSFNVTEYLDGVSKIRGFDGNQAQ